MALPIGTVTFVFTDIEGSTALLERLGDRYGDVLFAHRRRLRETWAEHGGAEVSTDGDAFFVAFTSASAAVSACRAAQAVLAAGDWPHDEPLRVRMGVHTGEPRMRQGDYWGRDVHYAARVASAARGGQVLVSAATAALVGSDVELTSLGEHRLKDFPQPRELFAVGPGPHPAPRSLDPLRSNLPSAPTPLIGREAEVEELTALLAGGERLITVIGTGGTGKTRVALAVADQLVDRLNDGAFLVELAELSSPDGVPGAIAGVFGVGGDATNLPAALGGREALLVLDNFEHVLDAAPLVGDLLAVAPRVRILTTSQAPLRVAGERVYSLAPLEVPREDTLQSLDGAPAATLLISRAQRAGRSFTVDEDNAAAVAALCRELDGSPLAIELAAARLSLLDPAELLGRLRRSPDALGRGGRDLPQRQRGLRSAMSWSYRLLDHDTARLFRRIGHFAGEATLERIEQVCGDDGDDVLESVASLVDLSLVRRTRAGRFELPSALRAFARELLEQSGERGTLSRHHARVLVDELLPMAVEQPFVCRPVLRRSIAAESSDVIALLEWAATADPELFGRLMAVSRERLRDTGEIYRWGEPLDRVIAAGVIGGRVGTLVRLASRVVARERDGWIEFARAADTENDALFAGWLLGLCAGSAINDGVTPDDPGWLAIQEVATELGASRLPELAESATDLEGLMLFAQGRWDEAIEAFEATIVRDGTTWLAESAGCYLGDCHLYAGRPRAALDRYVWAVRTELRRGGLLDVAFQAEGAVAALIDLGRHEEAMEALGASDGLAAEGLHPRDINPSWGHTVQRRVTAARAALGREQADAAYGRGAALSVDAAVRLLLALGEHATVTATGRSAG